MCNNQECKCQKAFKFELGKVYQSLHYSGYKIKILFVGDDSVFAKVLTSSDILPTRTVGQELIINNCSPSTWWEEYKEYKEPNKVQVKDIWLKDEPGGYGIYTSNSKDRHKPCVNVLGRIRITTTDGGLTSVEMFKS